MFYNDLFSQTCLVKHGWISKNIHFYLGKLFSLIMNKLILLYLFFVLACKGYDLENKLSRIKTNE